jgi:hypothetical protein
MATGRLARWLEHMQMFEFEILHTPGETNQLADALSRLYENDDIKEVPRGEFLEEHLKREDFASNDDFHHQTTLQPTKAYTPSSLHVEPPSSFYHFKPTSLFKPTSSFEINAMPSNGTSSNACNASMHWTACRSKDGCPFHYTSTFMETHSAFAPHHDNDYHQFSCGADNNNQWDASYDSDGESYTGPWYGPDEECPSPEDDPFENYQWLCDNQYIIPTEPGEILEVSPKQFDPASGEKRPRTLRPRRPMVEPIDYRTTDRTTIGQPVSYTRINTDHRPRIATDQQPRIATDRGSGEWTGHFTQSQAEENPPTHIGRRHQRRTHQRRTHTSLPISHPTRLKTSISRPKWTR